MSEALIVTADDYARHRSKSRAIEVLEARIRQLGGNDTGDTVHTFSEGLVARTNRIAAGILFTTRVHKVEHQFAFTEGSAYVWSKEADWDFFTAPKLGITPAGTRRMVLSITPCTMTTFHPNPLNKRDLAELDKDLYLEETIAEITEAEQKQATDFLLAISGAFENLAAGVTPSLPNPATFKNEL